MKLKDLNQTPKEEEIEAWLQNYLIGTDHNEVLSYTINNDLSVDFHSSVYLCKRGLKRFPFKIREVHGFFNCGQNSLVTLENGPDIVHGNFSCRNNPLLTIDFIPRQVDDTLFISHTKIKSLHLINKKMDYVKYIEMDQNTINLLGIFGIKSLEGVIFEEERTKLPAFDRWDALSRMETLQQLINELIIKGSDIHMAQEALLEAGFNKEARI